MPHRQEQESCPDYIQRLSTTEPNYPLRQADEDMATYEGRRKEKLDELNCVARFGMLKRIRES